MSGEVEQIDGNSPEYEAFVAKFRERKTSDDTFTPPNVYETVRDWAVRRYDIRPGTPIVRPFWPGGDYTRADYPAGCVVIDNPPFSILAKIVAWYNAHGVSFFLFAPAMTSLNICRDGKTAFVSARIALTFDNGGKIPTSFLTNMEPSDVLATTACDLRDALRSANAANEKAGKKKIRRIEYPDEVLTSARICYLSDHHTAYTVRRADAVHIRRLDNDRSSIFGSGFLLSRAAAAERAAAERAAAERAAAERAAAERAAAERAAAERAAAERIELSDRERAICDGLGGR